MMIKQYIYGIILVVLTACDNTDAHKYQPKQFLDRYQKKDNVVIYNKESGLNRFSKTLGLEKKQNYHLIIANNRSCNCGMADVNDVDSLVRLENLDFPKVWVINDRDTLFEQNIQPPDTLIYGPLFDLESYGFSTINPQIFTFENFELTSFKILRFK